jgi:hypothetical protein
VTYYTTLNTRDTALDELPTSLWDTLEATWTQMGEMNPLASAGRIVELDEATHGADVLSVPRDDEIPDPQRLAPDSPILPIEEARKRVRERGLDLTVDSDIPEAALDIMMDRAKERRRTEDVLSRGPAGFVPGAARLAVALAASLRDPINIGASFVPLVGPTRYAGMLARAGGTFGRAGVRAGVGAVEGAAGAAILSPLVYGAMAQEQADFDAWDIMFDIALGGALGGGLHVVGGAGLDIVTARRASRQGQQSGVARLLAEAEPETREAALRTSVAEMVTHGEVRSADALVRMDPAVSAGDGARVEAQRFTTEDGETFALTQEGAAVRVGEGQQPAQRAAEQAERTLFVAQENIEQMRALAQERVRIAERPGELPTIEPVQPARLQRDGRPAIAEPVTATRTPEVGRVPVTFRQRVPDAADPTFREAEVGRPVTEVTDPVAPSAREPFGRSRQAPPDAFAEVQARARADEPSALADPRASRAADETLAKAADEGDIEALRSETDDIIAEIQETADALDMGEQYAAELKSADLTEDAQVYGRAVRALANCQLRRGA